MHYRLDSKKSSLVDRVINGIKCGIYPAGSRMPSERQIAEYYDGSRTVVRQAIRELLSRQIIMRSGRRVVVHADALQVIENGSAQARLKVTMILTPNQLNFPIIQKIVSTVLNNISNDVCLSVLCTSKYLAENLTRVNRQDLIVVVGPAFDDFALEVIAQKCKAMLLLNMPHDRFNFITPDHYAGGRLMAKHLWENHHAAIGSIYLTSINDNEFGQRFNGARDFLGEHNLAIETVPVNRTANVDKAATYQQGFEYLYKHNPKITAILSLWDTIALDLYELIAAKGMKIPDDISMVGFDDQFYCSMVTPPLTTVRYPAEAIGLETAQSICGFLETGHLAIQSLITPTLLQRGSVKNLAPK
jgi:DNA-binding LacI/PurR family transcriptional regulator